MSTPRDDDACDLTPEEREILDYMIAGQADSDLRVTPREGRGPAPLSFAQQRLWFIERLEPGLALYVIPTVFRLDGDLDDGALERALAEIVQRHESLRTRFEEHDGTLFQVAVQNCPFSMARQDLSGISEDERDEQARQWVFEECARGFDLGAPPLIRASLIRMGDRAHILVLCVHHIAADFVSMGVLLSELRHLYDAFAEGLPSTLSPLPVQYADYAVWQRERLASEAQSDLLLYWQQQLAGLAPLEFAGAKTRPDELGGQGAECAIAIDATLGKRLRALARDTDATLFMIFLAGLWVLLHRLCGRTDIAVGTTVSTRSQLELEGLIGFFVNMLVLRMDLPGTARFSDVLREARRVALAAYAHQELPFERLIEALNPDRNAWRTPLLQVTLSMHALGEVQEPEGGLRLHRLARPTQSAHFDLEVEVVDTPNQLGLSVIYDTSMFSKQTIERFLDRYVRVLDALTTTPDCGVDEVSLLSDEECALQLETWVSTSTTYPRDDTVVSLFSAKAFQRGDARALEFGDRRMSYAELDAASDAVAMSLRARGVGRGDVVGVLLARGVDMVVSWLGILKAGGTYLPLDPSYPSARLGFMLSDSGARVLLVSGDVDGALETGAVTILDVNDAISSASACEGMVDESGDALDAAYIVYTSGSTGEPKGVVVPHRGIVRLVCGTDYLQLDEHDRVAQASNASFDAATFEVWGSLLNGGCLVGVEPEAVLDPVGFAALLSEHGVTTLFVTTALFNQFSYLAPSGFNTLDALLFGGEAVDVEAVRRVKAAGGPGRLLHVYGPTESTTFSNWYEIGVVPEDAVTIPIGRAVANTRLYVLGARQELLPVGVEGELYIGGDGLALGYLNREALTAERFVELASLGCERVYRTGDRVRWREDGVVEFIGRTDDQVKVRGHRIEPGEVEAVLTRHEAVKAAVVTSREDRPGERILVGYVVGEVIPGGLKDYLRERLPEYMVPDALVLLESLPLTVNGKVDHGALPAPAEVQEKDEGFEAPRSETEAVIAEAWCEVLGRERVGMHDNFFDLGGHSLLLTRLNNQVRTVMGISLPLRAMFEDPTVRGMARWVESAREQGGEPSINDEDREEFEL